jgi:DNA primase
MLHNIGISDQDIKRFEIGYAPHGFNSLSRYLSKKGWSEAQMINAGLIRSKRVFDESGGYETKAGDLYNAQVIFPVKTQGEIIGFVGFSVQRGRGTFNRFAYNSVTSDNSIFKADKDFYGLDFAGKSITKNKKATVVDNCFDAITLYLAGVDTTIAVANSSSFENNFSDMQAKKLRRLVGDYSESNMDPASLVDSLGAEIMFVGGVNALNSALDCYYLNQNSNVRVNYCEFVKTPNSDLCDLRKKGDTAIYSLLGGKKPVIEFLVDRTLYQADLRTVKGKADVIKRLSPYLEKMTSRLTQEVYIQQISKRIGVSEQLISYEIGKQIGANKRKIDRPKGKLKAMSR